MKLDIIPTVLDADGIDYPTTDGQPMAENMWQWEWIVLLKQNIGRLVKDRDDVLVASDNLIYPVRGNTAVSIAPDVFVAFGRPNGLRACYKVWQEDDLFPQVVMEVLSPSNTSREMERKRLAYENWGVREYTVIDPDAESVVIYERHGDELTLVDDPYQHVSPLLGLRFEIDANRKLRVIGPDDRIFFKFLEADELAERERDRADDETLRADQERLRADDQTLRADQERLRADAEVVKREKLAAKLRELGLDPDAL